VEWDLSIGTPEEGQRAKTAKAGTYTVTVAAGGAEETATLTIVK